MIPAVQVADWWWIIAEHPRRWCRICRRRRCWVQAEARGQLIAHGLWQLGPPIETTGDSPPAIVKE